MYHTISIAILQTEQSLNSSRGQVFSLILLKRAPNKAGLKLVFHSRNWPVPRTHHTLTEGVRSLCLLWKYNSKTELAGFSKWEQKLNKSQRSKCCNTCLYLSKSRFRSEARVYSPNIIKIALMSKRFFPAPWKCFLRFLNELWILSPRKWKIKYSASEVNRGHIWTTIVSAFCTCWFDSM